MLRFIFVMVVFFSLIVQPVWAAKPKPSVPDRVNKVNVFNKATDYWSTLGKTDIEKAGILKGRKEERRVTRLQSLQRKKNQQQQLKAKKMTEDMRKLKGLR